MNEATQIYFVALIVGLVITAGISIFFNKRKLSDKDWWSSFFQGISTEILGAFITGFLILILITPAEQEQSITELKKNLINDAGSQVNEVARRAIERIRERNWLLGEQGILQNADLSQANLQDANFGGVYLFNADAFSTANLRSTELDHAILTDAKLTVVDLSWAILFNTDLRGANLSYSQLSNATLSNSDLRGADLSHANLHLANLDDIVIDETTTLPDGTKWSPETDMTRFTDPTHTEFFTDTPYPAVFIPPS